MGEYRDTAPADVARQVALEGFTVAAATNALTDAITRCIARAIFAAGVAVLPGRQATITAAMEAAAARYVVELHTAAKWAAEAGLYLDADDAAGVFVFAINRYLRELWAASNHGTTAGLSFVFMDDLADAAADYEDNPLEAAGDLAEA